MSTPTTKLPVVLPVPRVLSAPRGTDQPIKDDKSEREAGIRLKGLMGSERNGQPLVDSIPATVNVVLFSPDSSGKTL